MINKRIFIIGGSGFVGASLRSLFERNNNSYCIGDKKISDDKENDFHEKLGFPTFKRKLRQRYSCEFVFSRLEKKTHLL